MTNQDKEYLRDLFACFAMNAIVSRGIREEIVDSVAENSYMMADAMMEARNKKEPKMGITAVNQPKRRSRNESK